MADTKSRELSVKLNVDVAEALTGLKAIQREAKKATQALRELEAAARLRETLHDDLGGVLAKYIGLENNDENRAKLAADVLREISGGESR